jgi:hypothetical protein
MTKRQDAGIWTVTINMDVGVLSGISAAGSGV